MLERGLDLAGATRRGEIVKSRIVLEGFADGEERVVAGALRDVGKPDWNVMSGQLLAEPADAAAVGSQQTTQTEKERGLSGIGPADESDDFTALDLEGDVPQRGDRDSTRTRAGTVGLVQTFDGQCDLHDVILARRVAQRIATSLESEASLAGSRNRCIAGWRDSFRHHRSVSLRDGRQNEAGS